MMDVLSFSGKSKSNLGWTPLHLACYFGHKDVVEELLKVWFSFLEKKKMSMLTSIFTVAHRCKPRGHIRKNTRAFQETQHSTKHSDILHYPKDQDNTASSTLDRADKISISIGIWTYFTPHLQIQQVMNILIVNKPLLPYMCERVQISWSNMASELMHRQ